MTQVVAKLDGPLTLARAQALLAILVAEGVPPTAEVEFTEQEFVRVRVAGVPQETIQRQQASATWTEQPEPERYIPPEAFETPFGA